MRKIQQEIVENWRSHGLFVKAIIIFTLALSVFLSAFGLSSLSDYEPFRGHRVIYLIALSVMIVVSVAVFAAVGQEKKAFSKFADFCWNMWTCVVTTTLASDIASEPLAGKKASLSSSMIDLYTAIQLHPGIGAVFLMTLLLVTAARAGFALGSLLRSKEPAQGSSVQSEEPANPPSPGGAATTTLTV